MIVAGIGSIKRIVVVMLLGAGGLQGAVADTATVPISIEGRVSLYRAPLKFVETKVSLALPHIDNRVCLVSADIDNDRRDEVLIIDHGSREVVAVSARDDGSISSRRWAQLPEGWETGECVAGDFYLDGWRDLAVMAEEGRQWLFLNGKQSGTPLQLVSRFDIPAGKVERVLPVAQKGASSRDGIFLTTMGENLSKWVRGPGGEQLWYHRSPTLRADATGEFAGTGGSDILLRNLEEINLWRLFYSSGDGAFSSSYAWLSFGRPDLWAVRGSGDFNGDGLSDVLLDGDRVMGWWVGLSDATQPLVQPLRGVSRRRGAVVVGDFNGDGLSDLVSAVAADDDPRQEALWFAWATPTAGVSGVTIETTTGQHATTDDDGRFKILAGDEEFLTPTKQGFVFSQTRLGMLHQFGRRRSRANFVATDITGGDGVIGRAVVLGTESGPGPYACVGYNPEWGRPWGDMGDRCFRGYAYFSFGDLGREDTSSRKISPSGACCRLPADDVLTGETVEVLDSCPEGFVGVGGRVVSGNEKYLICAKVNPQRYQLSPVMGGRYLGVGFSMWKERRRIEGSQIPVALRYALGRSNFSNWNGEACVGSVPGALVVGKRPGSCATIEFRELQYSGAPGDPPPGTPVPMLPSCSKIENEFDPLSGCRP